jgi:hypothetical protein
MEHSITEPRLTVKGIHFSVKTESVERKCFISRDALNELSRLKNIDATDADLMEVFHAFRTTIDGVAQRLIASNDSETPLVLTSNIFH